MSSNPLVKKIFNNVCSISLHIMVNTVLINYYPRNYSRLPFHSDNEQEICNDSWIYTLSLGSTRAIKFRDITSKMHLLSVNLHHGDLITFSRISQDFFEHAIDTAGPDNTNGYRISLTFRQISHETPYSR